MSRALSWIVKGLVVLACVAYQLLVHFALSLNDTGVIRIVALSLPFIVVAYWALMHAGSKRLWVFMLLAAAGATYVLVRHDPPGLAAAYGLPHAGAYILLLWFFGRTLRPGQEPLITRLARRVHGTLPAYMETYTRRLTAVWCVFFAAQLVCSMALFVFATLGTWSLFINLLNLPLLALIFIGEYLYRVSRYPSYQHASIATTIQAFTKDSSLSGSVRTQ
jgi:uncharacterized membrane protein